MPTDIARRIGAAAVASTLAAALAGCATDGQDFLSGADPNFGEAVRQTMAAQVIDPDPQYDYAVPESNGQHATAAIERYRTGQVRQPERVSTSELGESGNGSSMSNNGGGSSGLIGATGN